MFGPHGIRQGFGGLQDRHTQYVVGSAGEGYLFGFRERDVPVSPDIFVDALFQCFEVDSESGQRSGSLVVLVPYDAQEQVVRRNAVTACSHGFVPGEIYDDIQVSRYSDFHIFNSAKLQKYEETA